MLEQTLYKLIQSKGFFLKQVLTTRMVPKFGQQIALYRIQQ